MTSKKNKISPFVLASEINPANDQYKIKVRVMRIWKSFKTLEMVLIDTEGTRIHASIEESLVKTFQHKFAVGDAKIIDTFGLVDYDDVIGQIVNVDSLENIKTKGKDNVKLSFELQDLTYDVVDFVQINAEPKNEQPKVTLYEEFFVLNEKMTIDDILYALEVHTCVTIAKIISVKTLPRWYYLACKLYSQVGKERLYSCGVCDKDVTDLVLHVSYGSSPHIRLLFFDGLAQLLIGKKADELVATIAEDDPSIIPNAISSFIGKTMLFKVTIESYANADVNPRVLEITDGNDESSSFESASSPSKRRTSRKSGDSANSHNMITRKKIKTEKIA
ncbi:uncharacterized protein LOC111831745 [Capsella rubella]|uniref:uncharacterized protein LOC111831745 n=1 Tax=Capsella rubella TaxID=81985 RepID=UPI000CD4BC54|nr:uncharacterized protein LOC111831745 [Capsella rubella]